jgi:hypothetical protein
MGSFFYWYFVGYMLSVLMGVAWLILNIYRSYFSTYALNFRRVNMELSWLTGQPQPTYGTPVKWKLFGCGVAIILNSLLSWVAVLGQIYSLLAWLPRTLSAPRAIRETSWRLRNTHLTSDQICEALLDLQGAVGEDREVRRKVMSDEITLMGLGRHNEIADWTEYKSTAKKIAGE